MQHISKKVPLRSTVRVLPSKLNNPDSQLKQARALESEKYMDELLDMDDEMQICGEQLLGSVL